MAAPRFLAIDCGAGHAACGVFTAGDGGRLVLQQFVYERFDSDPSTEEKWADSTGHALSNLATHHKLGGACTVALPGYQTLTKFIRTPAVAAAKRSSIIEFEAQQAIPHALDTVVWDHVELAADGIDLAIMLSAVKRDVVERCYGRLKTAGFSAEHIVPSCLALQRAFAYNYPEVGESAILACLGARSTQLLFTGREHFYVRTIPLGGNHVTRHIADELKLGFASAESLKLQILTGRDTLPEHSPARAAVQRAAQVFAGRIQLEITRSSAACQLRHSSAAPPTVLYLAGGCALLPDLPRQLAERLPLRVERYDPLRNLQLGPRLTAGDILENAHALTELVGLATSLLVAGKPGINLLPPNIGEALVFRRRQPWLLAAAALVACVPLPLIWHYHEAAKAYQTQAARLDVSLVPLRALAARNAANLTRIHDAQKQIAALQGLVASKAGWLAFLADLQGRLAQVDDVWLDSLGLVSPGGNAGPAASTPAADALPLSPEKSAALRLTLSGRLLDRQNPLSKVSPESYERVKQLLGSFASSPYIAEVRDEQFDAGQPGILRFVCLLVVNPEKPLL